LSNLQELNQGELPTSQYSPVLWVKGNMVRQCYSLGPTKSLHNSVNVLAFGIPPHYTDLRHSVCIDWKTLFSVFSTQMLCFVL